jgi:hypothetical protein
VTGLGCCLCRRAVIAKGRRICTKCEGDFAPSPLRQWRDTFDMTIAEIVEGTGLSRRTVVNADSGQRMSHEVAAVLSKFTGLHWRKLRPKETK